jgi:peptidoglycan/xylan/chitin deacetylase (PgdA/CDA1 family)
MSRQSRRAVFLMYHELALAGRPSCDPDPGYARYVLDLKEFESQMRAIHEIGFCGTTVSEALNFAAPNVAITFDDGCETDLLAAAPILKQLGFGATFYITAGRLGKPGFLSSSQLHELSELGFEIGCHSMTHAYLSDLDDEGLRREIVEAKQVLEQIVSKPVEHFSCPGGRYDSRSVQLARSAGYRSFATSHPHANSPFTDVFSLGRVAIVRGLKPADFQKVCGGDGLWNLRLRMSLRDGAKRLLGNRTYDRMRGFLLKK